MVHHDTPPYSLLENLLFFIYGIWVVSKDRINKIFNNKAIYVSYLAETTWFQYKFLFGLFKQRTTILYMREM